MRDRSRGRTRRRLKGLFGVALIGALVFATGGCTDGRAADEPREKGAPPRNVVIPVTGPESMETTTQTQAITDEAGVIAESFLEAVDRAEYASTGRYRVEGRAVAETDQTPGNRLVDVRLVDEDSGETVEATVDLDTRMLTQFSKAYSPSAGESISAEEAKRKAADFLASVLSTQSVGYELSDLHEVTGSPAYALSYVRYVGGIRSTDGISIQLDPSGRVWSFGIDWTEWPKADMSGLIGADAAVEAASAHVSAPSDESPTCDLSYANWISNMGGRNFRKGLYYAVTGGGRSVTVDAYTGEVVEVTTRSTGIVVGAP